MFMVKIVGDPKSIRDYNISLYISGYKLYLMSQFYGVELGLKVHFVIWSQSHFEPILASVCWVYHVTRYRPLSDLTLSHEPVLWGFYFFT